MVKTRYRSLREYIDGAKTTQTAFAAAVGISGPHLSQILSGTKRPSLDVALRIEDITGIPVRDIVGRESAEVLTSTVAAQTIPGQRRAAERRQGGRRRSNRFTQPDRRKGPR